MSQKQQSPNFLQYQSAIIRLLQGYYRQEKLRVKQIKYLPVYTLQKQPQQQSNKLKFDFPKKLFQPYIERAGKDMSQQI